jgi:chaperone required for assembly of F1-ATPase
MFEVEAWGDDAEARARRDQAAADVALAERFMRLCEAG